MLDCQTFKLRDDDVLDFFGFQHLPVPIDQILHMPNGHGFEAGEESTYIVIQEAVDLPLTGELGAEGLGGDVGELLASDRDMLLLLASADII